MGYSRPEPLSREHRLESFDSGETSLDTWLARYSRHAQAAGSARVFVTTNDGESVVGFYALAAGEVKPEDATSRLLKGEPSKRPVPVVILARLAVDGRHQHRGLGRSLLADALLRCATVGESIGVRAVVVHAVSEGARAWYRRFGFEPSPTDPLHLVLLMKDLRRLVDDGRPDRPPEA